MARPTKFSTQRADAVLAALRDGHSRTEAARRVKVRYQTVRNWIKTRPEFREAVLEAETFLVDICVTTLRTAAAKNPKIALQILERRRPKDWAKRAEAPATAAKAPAPTAIEWVLKTSASSPSSTNSDSASSSTDPTVSVTLPSSLAAGPGKHGPS